MKVRMIAISRAAYAPIVHLLFLLVAFTSLASIGIMVSESKSKTIDTDRTASLARLASSVQSLDPVQNFLLQGSAKPIKGNTSLDLLTDTFHESLLSYVSGRGDLLSASHILALAISRPIKASEAEHIIDKFAQEDPVIRKAFAEDGSFVKEIVARRLVDNANRLRFGSAMLEEPVYP